MANYSQGNETIANSYAKTLLDLTEEAGRTDEVLAEFKGFSGLLREEPRLGEYLASQMVDGDRRAFLLEKSYRGRMNDLLLSTLQVIIRKGRGGLIPQIYEQYRLAVEEARNEIDVHVTSAVPLGDVSRRQLIEAATRVAGKTARLVEHVDDSILGGLVIRIGDEKLDGSVLRHLQRIAQQLHERAVHEIHRGEAYVEGAGNVR